MEFLKEHTHIYKLYWCCLVTMSNSFAIPQTAAHQAPLSMGFTKQEYWSEWIATSFSRGSSWPRDWTHISCTGKWILYHWATHTHTAIYIYLHLQIDRYKKTEKIRFRVLKMEVEIKHQKLATLQPNPFHISVVFDVLSVKICFSTNI